MPRVIKSKYIILKIFWFLAFLGGLAAASYLFINSLINYFQYQPVVQVKLIQEFPTLFPAVTICNLNPFPNLYKLSKSKLNQSDLFNEDSLSSKNIAYYFVEAQENLKRFVETNLNSSEKQVIGFSLKDSLISCSFNNKVCDSSNFNIHLDYNNGNCYTFNEGKNESILNTTLTGSNYGLTLEILTGDPTVQTLPKTSQGLLLVAHNQTQTLTPTIQLINAINIPPGYDSYVSINREFHSKLPSPYSNCIIDLSTSQTFGTVLYNYMIASGISTYDQASCIRLCYQKVVQDTCRCYDPKYPKLENMTIKCLSATYQVPCILNITQGIFLQRNDYINICGFDCPIECNTIDYSQSISSAFYPSEHYVSVLANKSYLTKFNTSGSIANLQNSVRNYLVKVTVNYNQLEYTYIQEQPSKEIFALVGEIGGNFGLFIGISILSVTEVLELLIDIWIYTYSRYFIVLILNTCFVYRMLLPM